jgi:hypothetical protein
MGPRTDIIVVQRERFLHPSKFESRRSFPIGATLRTKLFGLQSLLGTKLIIKET